MKTLAIEANSQSTSANVSTITEIRRNFISSDTITDVTTTSSEDLLHCQCSEKRYNHQSVTN